MWHIPPARSRHRHETRPGRHAMSTQDPNEPRARRRSALARALALLALALSVATPSLAAKAARESAAQPKASPPRATAKVHGASPAIHTGLEALESQIREFTLA